MDEKLINQTIEEYDVTKDIEINEIDVPVEDIEDEVFVEETVYDVAVESEEEVVVDISESMGWVSGDDRYHDSLLGVDFPRQHPITAITGLREELDEIERLKTIYSDKFNVANYYEWENAAYDTYGYFVSFVPGASKIKICDGSNIFGVSVSSAGFIGGQDANIPRDNNYGLIVTSGLVDVRCELDVEVGDYVDCNVRGYAEKSKSNYGYRVLAKNNKNGVEYAVIALGVQADVTNLLGIEMDAIESRVHNNEQNIVSAINVANQAYNKSVEAESSASASKSDVEEALKDIFGFGETLDEIEKSVASSTLVAAQAKAIADSAATSAASMRKEAVDKANETWDELEDLMDNLEPIITWEDPDNEENKGAQYFTEYISDGLNTKVDIETFKTKTEEGFHAIERNARELQSFMTVIDKYSVGEYSQANGLTLEQAQSILEIGMIYVPTSHEKLDVGTRYHKEEYTYKVGDETKTYTRWFTPGYLYRWDTISNEEVGIGWLTIGNNTETNEPEVATREEDYSSSQVLPNVGPWVFFSTDEPNIHDEWNCGYWFTSVNNDETKIVDKDGKTGTYDRNTLYKWERPKGEDPYWFAVATLAGNSQNRATSMIRQTANEIALEVTNAYGAVAGSGVHMKEDHARVNSIAAWPSEVDDKKYNMAILEQKSDKDGAYMTLATIRNVESSDGKKYPQLESIGGAKIVLADTEDGDSFIQMDADHINFTAEDYTVLSKNIKLNADQIDFTVGDFGGRNFLRNSEREFGHKVGTEKGEYYALPYDLTPIIEEYGEDQTYTLSFDLKTRDPSLKPGETRYMAVYPEPGDPPLHKYVFPRTGFYVTDKYKRIHITFTPTRSSNTNATTTRISVFGSYGTGNIPVIKNVKFELGAIPTDWTPAPEDKVETEQISTQFSWKMLPDKCVWWNNLAGTNSESTPLMKLDSTGLRIKGTVEATSGYIGTKESGWAINATSLTNGTPGANNSFCMYTYHSNTNVTVAGHEANDWRLMIGSKFGVDSTGTLYANGARIVGEIIADEGQIGGWNINNDGLLYGNSAFVMSGPNDTSLLSSKTSSMCLYAGDGEAEILNHYENWKFDTSNTGSTSGTLIYEFNINIPNGYIYSSIYDVELLEKESGDLFNYYLTSYTTSVNKSILTIKATFKYSGTLYQCNTALFVRYKAYVPPFRLLQDGSLYASAIDISSSNSTTRYQTTIKNGFIELLYNDETGIRINPTAFILAHNDHAWVGGFSSNRPWLDVGKIDCISLDSVGNINTEGTLTINDPNDGGKRICADYRFLQFYTNSKLIGRLSNTGESISMYGTWQLPANASLVATGSNVIGSSDRKLKNTINMISDQYDIFFDNLIPSTFKYNDGTSDRLHSGFIAQEVKDALDKANLSTQEFAGYVDCTGIGLDFLALRYEEFISLNTWQIQKLKPRVTTLEEKVQILEAENAQLKEQMAQLLNSNQ